MTRSYDWPERMAKALDNCRSTPFSWGSHDCGLFVCDITQIICGIDFAADLRGRYKTSLGAARVLKRFAGGLEEATEKIMHDNDCLEVKPLTAQRGDIILAKVLVSDDMLRDSLGVCLGERVAFASERGFVQLPLIEARRAWRIP